MTKFKLEKQYRLPEHDYSSEGCYFITICTKNRENFFGEIQNGIMGLNEIGCMTAKFWQEIPIYFNNVGLNEWVIMPNHVHGIIMVKNTESRRNLINQIPTDGIPKNPMEMERITIGYIVRRFKGKSAHEIRKYIDQNFAWQSRFHDRVIRNDDELNRIREYIQYNPQKWEYDRNNKNSWI